MYTQKRVKEVSGKHIDTFEQAVRGLQVEMELHDKGLLCDI